MSKPNFPEVPVDVSAGQRFLTITVDMRAICAVSDPYPGYEVEITDTSNAATSLVDALVDDSTLVKVSGDHTAWTDDRDKS